MIGTKNCYTFVFVIRNSDRYVMALVIDINNQKKNSTNDLTTPLTRM